MPTPMPIPVPEQAFLAAVARRGAFADCYAVEVQQPVALAELIEAFYTTRLFKLERWLLARLLGIPSTDADAQALARGSRSSFSAWRVESRASGEILLDAGQTRSWLAVEPVSPGGPTRLLFGSAVLPRRSDGGFGPAFHALLGFHRLYSRLLLGAAARQLSRGARGG